MHVLLYKTVEGNDVRVKRGDKSDVCQSNVSNGGWKLQSDFDDAISPDWHLRSACDEPVIRIGLAQRFESSRIVANVDGRGRIKNETVVQRVDLLGRGRKRRDRRNGRNGEGSFERFVLGVRFCRRLLSILFRFLAGSNGVNKSLEFRLLKFAVDPFLNLWVRFLTSCAILLE